MGELGVYSDFPTFSHLTVRLLLNRPELEMAALITRALRKLNNFEDSVDTSVAGHSGSITVKRYFEVGIAEGPYFNYLDEHEVNRVSELIVKPSSVDFIVYINYRYLKEGRLTNLLPDRHIIRFSLSSSELKLFQISGLRRTDPEVLVVIVAGLINCEARACGYDRDIICIEDIQEPQKN